VQLVYFARVREAIGVDGEERAFPDSVSTVAEVVSWLAGQGGQYATAFAEPAKLRFALDQKLVADGAAIAGASELAIFPPVTGG
jgi:sulfur-carrier protein